MHWSLKSWCSTWIFGHLWIIYLSPFLLRLWWLGLFLLLGQIHLLSNNRSAVHPVQCNQQWRVYFCHLRSLKQFSFHHSKICFFIIRKCPDILKKFWKLRWKNIRWEEIFRLYIVFVLHHFFEAFLISFISPR